MCMKTSKTSGCCITTMCLVTASFINNFLTSKNIHVIHQPPYSPCLSPCDFFSSWDWKSASKDFLRYWKTFKRLQMTRWRVLQCRSSSTVTRTGRTFSSAVCGLIAVTLKGIMWICNFIRLIRLKNFSLYLIYRTLIQNISCLSEYQFIDPFDQDVSFS